MVARHAALTLAATALLLAVAGSAAAATSVTIVDLPESAPEPLGTNGTAALDFTVQFTADGFGCASASSVPITIAAAATGLPATFTWVVEPETVEIAIPAGLYPSTPADAQAPVRPFTGSAPARVTVAAGLIEANATGTLTVTATYAGGTPQGCQAPSALPGAEASGLSNMTVMAPPPIVEPTPPPPERGLPAPGVVPVALAAAGLALAMRRRNA